MKKTLLYSFLPLLVAMMMGVTFTACSDDDDDDNSLSTSTLVGTWYIYWYDEPYEVYSELTFYADGTGLYMEKDLTYNGEVITDFGYNGGKQEDYSPFTWSLDGDIMTYHFDPDGIIKDDIRYFRISINGDNLLFYNADPEDEDIVESWKRKK